MLPLVVFSSYSLQGPVRERGRISSQNRPPLCAKLGSLIDSDVGGYGSYLWGLGRIFVPLPCSLGCDLCPSYPVGRVSRTLAMCSSEEADLLRLEEVFSTSLARTISLVLQPLLSAGECSGREGAPEWPPGIRFLPCQTF